MVQARIPLSLVVALTCLACGEFPGPDMRPGADCLECHRAGDDDPVFTAAGTVFDFADRGIPGVTVSITDSQPATRTATTSTAGNFYFTESLVAPLQVSVTMGSSTLTMPADASRGSCNSCHQAARAGKIRMR